MDAPIRLNTQYGYEQFHILYKQKQMYSKSNELLKDFQEVCLNEYRKMSDYFKYFLEDEDMTIKYKLNDEDEAGWKIHNELSDMCSVLLYFSGNENKVKEFKHE